VTALLLAALLAQAQPPVRDARPPAGVASSSIAGVVIADDAQARPLRRARVTLNGQALNMGRSVITADDGSFAFDRVPPGRFTVGASKDGYVSLSYGSRRPGRPGSGIQVAEQQSVRVTLRLPRGAVITGTVMDIDGLPAQGIPVTALARRYVGQVGDERYLSAGTPSPALSDDRGVYRIYGLPAGEYIVAVQPQARPTGLGTGEVRTVSRGVVSNKSLVMTQVFYPGATEVGRAARVTVTAGEERGGTDIQLQYVPLATLSGTVTTEPGWDPANVTIVRADEAPGLERALRASADGEGHFSVRGVSPGRYRITAQSSAASVRIVGPGNVRSASADVIVDGDDVDSISLTLQPGLTIAGLVAFEGERPPPLLPSLRLPIPAMGTNIANAGYALPPAQIDAAGRFSIAGVVPGPYRLLGAMRGVRMPIGEWWLKSLVVNGRDILDSSLELRQNVDDAVVTFTDRATEIAGTLTDAGGNAVPEMYVVAFSADRSAWFFNSRRVAGVRPDPQGRFAIRNLPPGDYRLAAVPDLDQGDWFDPSLLERLLPAATPVTLTTAEKKVHDLVVR
jgi:hypothetical protein